MADEMKTIIPPKLWEFEGYTEIQVEADTEMANYPEAFGKFILNIVAKGEPVVVIPKRNVGV